MEIFLKIFPGGVLGLEYKDAIVSVFGREFGGASENVDSLLFHLYNFIDISFCQFYRTSWSRFTL